MIKKAIEVEGQGSVEFYGVADNNVHIKFRPCSFLCQFCGNISLAKVSPGSELECLSCGEETKLAEGKRKQAILWGYGLASLLPILLLREGPPDSVLLPAFVGGLVVSVLAFVLLMRKKDMVYKRWLSSICLASMRHRGILMFLLLPTWLYAAYIIMATMTLAAT